MSEPRYFAEQQLAWMDLDCGVTHKGCINMPNCDEIMERVGGDGELARKMYYVLQSYHNMNLIAGVISVSLSFLFLSKLFLLLHLTPTTGAKFECRNQRHRHGWELVPHILLAI